MYALDLSPKVSVQCSKLFLIIYYIERLLTQILAQVASIYASEHEWDKSKAVQLQNYFKPCITLSSLNNVVRILRTDWITIHK